MGRFWLILTIIVVLLAVGILLVVHQSPVKRGTAPAAEPAPVSEPAAPAAPAVAPTPAPQPAPTPAPEAAPAPAATPAPAPAPEAAPPPSQGESQGGVSDEPEEEDYGDEPEPPPRGVPGPG